MHGKSKNVIPMIRKEYIKSNIVYTLRKVKRIDILIADIIKETLEKDILRADRKQKINLILNLKGIKFIDSYSFRVLIELTRISEIYNKPLYFTNISEEIDELINLLKLEKVFIKRRIDIPYNRIAA